MSLEKIMLDKFADFYLNPSAWDWPYKPIREDEVSVESPFTEGVFYALEKGPVSVSGPTLKECIDALKIELWTR